MENTMHEKENYKTKHENEKLESKGNLTTLTTEIYGTHYI